MKSHTKNTNMQSRTLSNKILFVVAMLLIFRLGTYIPLPGVDANTLAEVAEANATGILGVFNMFTGGALGRLSIFALNIMPYITASIIMQLLTVVFKELGNIKKEGESGRNKIAKYTRYLAIVLATFQGYGIAVGAESLDVNGVQVVIAQGVIFRIIATISMVGGTVFVMWLTDQISIYGIGNGSSLLIFTGIVAGLPSAVATLLEMGKSGTLSTFTIIAIMFAATCIISLIVFMERAFRKIPVHYPKRVVGRKMYAANNTYLPLKINTSGVLAQIFASSLLLFPTTIITLASSDIDTDSFVYTLMLNLGHGKLLFILLYILLIFFFSFFYTSAIFNPDETAENLRKSNAIVQNRRPGKPTAEYIDQILTRLTCIGAAYVSLICIVPEILISQYAIPMYFGGTSLLIVVNVIIDIFQQIQAYMLTTQYSGMMKNNMLMLNKKK